MTENVKIDVSLVRQLVAAQFPHLADLPIAPVEFDGWDNTTFHLGERMSVRLPSAEGYTLQVAKEQRWLPKLAPLLPLPIPVPLAMGAPGEGYPWPWSVYRWLDGDIVTRERVTDLRQFAISMAEFLVALQGIDATDGPPPGPHNFHRGGPLSVYDHETRDALAAVEALGIDIDTGAAREVWDVALATTWEGHPVWIHGDVAVGNLLVQHGRLAAVIDFGTSGVGDPACDLAIAWTFLTGESREAFRAALPLDEGTWARGRAWTLWKALKTVIEYLESDPPRAEESRHIVNEVIAEHRLVTG